MNHWSAKLDKIPTNSLLVSTSNNSILRFYCPITAICHHSIADIKHGEHVAIDGIYHDNQDQLFYLIDGLRLPHNNFHII